MKTQGEFTRHSHPDTDELFLVLRGRLTVRLDDGDVELGLVDGRGWNPAQFGAWQVDAWTRLLLRAP